MAGEELTIAKSEARSSKFENRQEAAFSSFEFRVLISEKWAVVKCGGTGGPMGTKTGISWEEFLHAGKEGQRRECVDGEVVFMSPVFGPHGRVTARLDYQLVGYTNLHPERIAYGTDVAFRMSTGNWRCPDAALVRKERVDAAVPDGPPPFAPDVAFEVLSPGDARAEVQSKRQDYYESNVIQVWLDPQRKTAEVISPNQPAQFLRGDQILTIAELPDFRLDLKALFSI
jgi:Uma2 family endonuclease